MRISWTWLAEFVDLTGQTPQGLADLLTMRGLEVEGVDYGEGTLDRVRVARVLEVSPHPDADRLRVCTVELGELGRRIIVCGAPNVAVGLHVAAALPGAVLPGGRSVAESAIRGVGSAGMLCSELELGLGEDASGLWCLPPSSRPGESLVDHLLRDEPGRLLSGHRVALELSITPNRGDCLSHLGVAREVAAALGRPLQPPTAARPEVQETGPGLSVELADPIGCPRYLGVVISGVQVAPSPAWLRTAVEACGARSVSNIVDVTNYVAFELGHPQHAFDLAAIADGRVVVRRARAGESLEAIDHVIYALQADDLVIADGRGPVALAGVMGGVDSEISERTTAIVLECAYFAPSSVRRTSKRLGLHSESSHRFERGVDPNGLAAATARAIALIARTQAELGRSLQVQRWVDAYPAPIAPGQLGLRPERVNAVLGTGLTTAEMVGYLEPLGLACVPRDGALEVQVPTWRFDLEREIDLIEEVVRCYGVDRLAPTLPEGSLGFEHTLRSGSLSDRPAVAPTIVAWRRLDRERRLRRRLVSDGLHETVHYAFTSRERIAGLGFTEADPRSRPVAIANPMSAEQSVMRTSLLAEMLPAVARNQSRQADGAALFELARVYWAAADGAGASLGAGSRVAEPLMLGLVLWGLQRRHWSAPPRGWDAHDLTGLIRSVGDALGWRLSFEDADDVLAPFLHPGVRVAIRAGDQVVGACGEVHPRVLASSGGMGGPVFAAELRVDGLLGLALPVPRVATLPRFPHSARDAALLVDRSLSFAALAASVEAQRPPLLARWELFDVYEGKGIPEGKRSLALSFVYRDPEASEPERGRTLTDDEVAAAHGSLVAGLCAALGAERR